jgi:drug/metabolite transporter (DMT)-like permease
MSWIIISIFAALTQTIRTSLQKQLKASLSTSGVTWVRFGFGLPFAILYFVILKFIVIEIPDINGSFILNCLIASICQIVGTFLLISLFSYKNFAVSTLYAKTEVIQTAIIGIIFFGEYLTISGILAILLGVIGILAISVSEEKINLGLLINSITKKCVILGILSGTFFSLSALFIKNASTHLNLDMPVISSSMTLLTMTIIQTLILGIYLFKKEKDEFIKIGKNFKLSTLVGLTSIIGSIGWFTAFVLTNVAYVKTVGQIELLFSIFIAHKIFKEKFNKTEIFGSLLVIISILILIAIIN